MLCARSAETAAQAGPASVVRQRKRSHHRQCLGSFRSLPVISRRQMLGSGIPGGSSYAEAFIFGLDSLSGLKWH
jgi:hypothetical protein